MTYDYSRARCAARDCQEWTTETLVYCRRHYPMPPCPCECNRGEFCGGCGHVGCGMLRSVNYGPVANPDGTPTEATRRMLAGTGRDPVEFARRAGITILSREPDGFTAVIRPRKEGPA